MKATAVIVLVVLVLLVVVALVKTVKVIPQASAAIVERFGRYTRTLHAGLNILVPFIDRIRQMIDLREQVVPFPPQPVITEDNLVVQIDTVIYFQVTDPRAATYEIANYIQAIEQLTITTLRNIIGGMDLEQTLTSREEINAGLRGVLDEATGRWGIRVNRVELKAIEPPPSIQDSMEKQMRAERDKRAAILTAEGHQRSQVLTAEGDKEAAVLRAEGERQAAVIRAEGEARAIETVFEAIHAGEVDNKLLAYQYLQMLPRIAEGSSNKLWILPSEVTRALEGIGDAVGNLSPNGSGPAHRVPRLPLEEEPAWPGSATPSAGPPSPIGPISGPPAPVRKQPAGNGAPSAPRPPAEPPTVPAPPIDPPRRGGAPAGDVEPPHIERGHRPPR
ncbi:paraslipin [Embleya hyalina]|uniref:Paraslipin n=1 Tax=Embleya hyalina TaxID=516124 RepID=A0A401YYN8_9ACTN|nr:paraslipin [Embleya hyalina]